MKTTIINKILLVLMLITAQQVSALEFQVDGIYYRTSIFTKNSAYVTHSGTSYTESVEYQGEVVIPESVTYNGKTYTIASIGGYAFAGCPGLTSVTIPNTVTTINQNAFNGCTGLKTIECKATTPPALGDNAFTSCDATLVVPSSSESVYKSAAGWSNFKFKEESSETPGSGENSGEDSGSDNSGSDNTYGLTCKILNSTDVAIIAGSEKYTGDIVIPSQVIISGKTYNVTKIGERAFDGCAGLTSITIPNSVTSIGDYAFYSCTGLTSIEIPSSITSIGNYFAFNSGLTRVVIPNSVTSIGNSAFWNCFGLTSIAIPNSVTSIGDSAFVLCTGLTSVEIPNSVTSIGTLAFSNCSGLTSVTIGNSVTGIGESAFADCTGLTSVTSLSTTPPTCGTDVFKNVNIANIPLTIPAGSESLYKATEPWKNFKYDETTDEPELPTDTSGLSYNIISDTEVEVIAATEKYSGDIVIPSQTTIEGKAYNVTKIADEAFYACSGLKTITIPNSVTSIGNYVLGNCPNLTSIVVESGNKKYDSRNNCNAIIETSTNSLIAGCKNSVIPSSVTTIGTASFMGCTGLTSITIPSSVVSLGEDAFYECTGLTSMTIPNSVTSIGDNVFAYCSNLKTITLSTNIKTISYSAFLDCYSLTSITVPNSVITIEEEAFCGCDGLADVIIGNSVASIGNHAFLNCGGLTSVTMLNSTPPSCGTDVFKNVNVSNVTLTVPTGSVSVYKSADTWKDFKYEQTEEEPSEPEIPTDNSGLSYNILNSTEVEVIAGAEKYTGDIVIPSQTTIDGKVYNVTQIGDAAFQDCTNLTSVTIPNLVVSIGESALKGCINLISVVIGNSVTSIGNSAFYGCTSLTSVTIPNSVTSIGNYAFYGNSNLTSVTSLNPTPPTCGTDVFGGVNVSDILLIVPAGSKSLYNTTDTWKDFKYKVFVGDVVEVNGLSYKIVSETTVSLIAGSGKYSGKIVVPSEITIYGNKYNVIDIGDMAFYGCTDLTSVTIPNSVISIGDNAMKGCTGLTSVTIGNSVTSIGSSAFYDCANLKDVFISELSAWCKIDFGSSFSNPLFHAHVLNLNGTEIKDLVIPESVNEIKSYAFSSCAGLTSITIHKSVSNIGDYAFESCTNLTSITVQNPTPPTCGRSVFYNVSMGNITLEVPAESVSMYQSADTWKDFGTIETYISSPVGLSKMWAIPFDPSTGYCSVRTATGYGESLFGNNYQAGVVEEWKDGALVASYDVNKFCADNNLGETIQALNDSTQTYEDKFVNYTLWTGAMMDDAGNLMVNVGPGPGTASTCQNWVLLPASDRNAMQLLHIAEFPTTDVALGRVDVPSRMVGNITESGAYMYIPASGSALLPVMYVGLNDDGKIYYDAESSWTLMSSTTFDASTNVATFQTADEILNAADEAGVAAKTYVRWRGQGAPFTWNAETSQFEKNTAVPQGAGTAGMDVFKIGEVEYMVVPVKSATTGSRGSSVAVYNLADGSEVANWDSGCSVDYYVGSVQARVNPDGKTANIYVCGHKDCFGILKFYPGSSVKSIANEGLSYGKGSSALDEIVTEENAAVEYYNLQGVRVMNPEKGIYIKRQGGKTSKVVL